MINLIETVFVYEKSRLLVSRAELQPNVWASIARQIQNQFNFDLWQIVRNSNETTWAKLELHKYNIIWLILWIIQRKNCSLNMENSRKLSTFRRQHVSRIAMELYQQKLSLFIYSCVFDKTSVQHVTKMKMLSDSCNTYPENVWWQIRRNSSNFKLRLWFYWKFFKTF